MVESNIENHSKLLVFSISGQRYALSLSRVEKVIRSVEISPLPKAPEIVLGVINLQGLIIPVFNIRRRFGLPEKAVGVNDQLIIAGASRRVVALAADFVGDIIEMPHGKVIESKKILPDMEYVEGVVKLGGGIAFIHDLARFLSLEEEEALEEAMKKAGSGNEK